MKSRLLLVTLLLGAQAAAQDVACVDEEFLSGDTTVKDITCSGFGTPEATIIMGLNVTSLNGANDNATLGLGVSDFTTQANVYANAEHNLTSVETTDACSHHDATTAMEWGTEGSCIIRRTATVATTTDGVRFTPNNSTELYNVAAANLHIAECHAFSAGQGTTSGNTFAVTHGLTGTPDFGIFFYTDAHNGAANHGHISVGFMNDNGGAHVQKAVAVTYQAAQTDGEGHGRIYSDRVAGTTQAINGNSQQSIELTASNATSTTFTARDGTLDGDLVGLLCYDADVSVWVGNLTSPNSAGTDWTDSNAGFAPTFMMSALTTMTAEDTSNTDSAAAGTLGVLLTDFSASGTRSSEITGSFSDENGASPTDTQSRVDTELVLPNDAGVVQYRIAGVETSGSGIDTPAANIFSASATSHLWPTILLRGADPAPGGGTAVKRRRR